MRTNQEQTVLELDESGHLSDEAIVACADGQLESLSPLVLRHLDGCDACSQEVSAAAELSLRFDLALAPEVEQALLPAAAAKRGVPKAALAAGLMIALVGLLPSVVNSAAGFDARPLLRALAVTLRSLPQLVSSFRGSGSLLGTAAPFVLSVILLGVGTAIALRQTLATRNQNA